MHPREQAAIKGEPHYDGSPCRTCGNTKRYTINASCMHCQNERAKESTKKRREYIKEKLDQAKGSA